MAAERRLLLALATVVALAGGVYLNSLGNRFALDDEGVIATDGDPFGFHLVNVLLHATVSALVLLLLLGLGAAIPAAWAGAAVFAVHPVHVEAVATVVGRAELLAARFFLAAAIVYDAGRSSSA